MKKYKEKILSIILIVLSIIAIGLNCYAHSGRTDSNGGHKDNKNKSGLGNYHYHCGGYPAHLHKNGVCPYASNKDTNSSNKNTTTKTTITVTGIKINENIDSIEVGKSKTLTAAITPDNATDKTITWKSSDESIATINQNGEINAKNTGTVDITVSTKNGKTDTLRINIKEKDNKENNVAIQAISMNNSGTNNSGNNTVEKNKSNDVNPLGTIAILSAIVGGAYWVDKKNKRHDIK